MKKATSPSSTNARAAMPAPQGHPTLSPDAARPESDQSTSEAPRPRQRFAIETRAQMLERLTNPPLSLHEASVLLRVCPATVRRYADAGLLPHQRTTGGQRRFRLRDVLLLLRQNEARRRR